MGKRPSQSVDNILNNIVRVAAVKSQASIVSGQVGGKVTEIMLDSGSSVSLMTITVASMAKITRLDSFRTNIQLVTASGDRLPIVYFAEANVCIAGKCNVNHTFAVVDNLVSPVILGLDFLQANQISLDFASTPVKLDCKGPDNSQQGQLESDTILALAKQDQE